MQKKIIALAVAALASGAALAQSNVTIYGIADGTFDNIHVSGGATAANNVSYNRVSANSSYIGFKGAEDLGNGVKAVFQYENTVGFDSAAAINGNRDSFVGLSSNAGTVVLGTLTGPTRALGGALDVNAGATGIGANSGLLGKLGNNLSPAALTIGADTNVAAASYTRSSTQTSIFDTRWKNAIAYVSPSFSGLTATAAYVANEGKTAGATPINTSGYDVGLSYNNGPLMVGLTHNGVSVRNSVSALGLGTDIKTANTRLGSTYDFGVAKIAAVYDRTTADASVSGHLKQNVWGLGATVPVTASGKIIGQFYKANDMRDLAGDQSAKLWEIGYVQSLSKRTEVRAVYARLNNGANVAYDFGVNATGVSSADATLSGVQIGVRHAF